MRLKILSKRKLFSAIFAGCVIFLAIFFYFFQQNYDSSIYSRIENGFVSIIQSEIVFSKQERLRLPVLSGGRPVHLRIPAIRVDAVVESVSLTSAGAVGVPKGPTNTAWFNLGPRPGERGSAVIDGHFGWKNGIPAAFDNLYKLQKGDKLYVEDENGKVISFIVRGLRRYGERDDVSAVFISNDGKSHLNLITCEGVWDPVYKSYSKRLVVFADKEVGGER